MRGQLRQRLKTDAECLRLAGGRVYWGARPQGGKLPDVTLTVVSAVRGQTLRGPDGSVLARVQFDVRGGSYEDAFELAQAVDRALRTLTAAPFISGWSLLDETDETEDLAAPGPAPQRARRIHRNRRDYRISYLET